ncbi:lipopolysaccharide biosynthesis protein [Pedobacter frigiditerrae]|uniref:Lipopolysaccharide biosynthesis protein n=1 Tax=Pedobacter frigiditerrae TaxID=2530452 RepID=A0A4R0N300_9SPHI|nr:Wzz/FepE/Etk N-terminal domain-containing protein [Pedobacter frigiditerrae]TCC94150.1 lipopolysaccharide biosynthesis protein [Pedobacter frigiditerrae]
MTAEDRKQYLKSENKEMSLKELILKIQDWLKYVMSKWLVILSLSLLGGVLGVLYAYLKKPIYTATTTFVLEDEKGGGGLSNLAGLASMAGVDIGGSGGSIFQGDNILGLYKSRTILVQTLLTPIVSNGKKQLLVERYIDFNELRQKWANKPALTNLQFSDYSLQSKPDRLRDSILNVIVMNLNTENLSVAKPDKKLSSIQVDVSAKDEIFAKTFNDELVKNVNEFYIVTKTKKNLQNVKILQHKTDSVRAIMNGAIYKAASVSDATPNLNPTRQVQRVAPMQKMQFSAETNKAVLGELVKNLEMSKMALLKETPLIQLVDEPVFPLKIKKVSKIITGIIGSFCFGFITALILICSHSIKMILSK